MVMRERSLYAHVFVLLSVVIVRTLVVADIQSKMV